MLCVNMSYLVAIMQHDAVFTSQFKELRMFLLKSLMAWGKNCYTVWSSGLK